MTQNSQMKQVYDENKECFNKIKKSLCDNNIQTGFIVHPNDTNSYWNNYRETIKQNIPEDIVGDVLYLVDNYKINDFLYQIHILLLNNQNLVVQAKIV